MKYFFIILFASLQLSAQESYQNISKKLENTLQTYQKAGKENTYLNTIISNFNQSEKSKIDDLQKDNVGICIVLYENNPDLIISPAKYTYDDDKINISAIGPQNPGELPAYMKEYVQKYLTEFESLGNTKLFKSLIFKKFPAQGIFNENRTEYIVNEPNTLSFIRGNSDWMFIISIDENYKNLANPRIIVYCFKKSISGKDIFNADNSAEDVEKRRLAKQAQSEKDKEKYPLFHDFRIDDLRIGLKQLLEYEPYKSDQELINRAGKLNEKLDRFTIRNYVEELKYFAVLKISDEFLKEHFEDPPQGEYEVENIIHLSVHALGDIYFSEGNYPLAKEFYTKAIFTDPLVVRSGTTFQRDIDRITYDLGKSAYKARKKDEAYGFLVSLMFDSNINTKDDIETYFTEQNEDKKQFKKDLDKALKTLKKGEKYSYNFTFRENNIFFIPMLQATIKSFQEVFRESEFYKSLQ